MKLNRILSFIIILVMVASLAPSFSYAQGVAMNFFIDSSQDQFGRGSISTKLNTISNRAYIYVENTFWDSLSELEKINLNSKLVFLGVEFDTVIYPKLRNIYGLEWNPGIDNDPRIYIVVTDLKNGLGGFVDIENEKVRSLSPTSNEHEMIYLNSDIIFSDNAKGFLAHEFVHLIEYNVKVRLRGVIEEPWLSEALADYAPTALGYNNIFEGSFLESRTENFLSLPTNSLIGWSGQPADFATSSLFIHFLVGRYGVDILQNLIGSNVVGPLNIERTVQGAGGRESFGDIFSRWVIANYVNSATKEDGEYFKYAQSQLSYPNLHIKTPVQYSVFSDNQVTASILLKSGSAQWIKFIPTTLGHNGFNNLNLDFNFEEFGLGAVPYIVTDINGQVFIKYAREGNIGISDFGNNVLSVVLVPFNNEFNAPDSIKSFSITGSLLPSGDVLGSSSVQDGSLIRAAGDSKVYVIKNDTRRWIPSPEIFNGYGHLRWEDIIEVAPETLSSYTESHLIKFEGDYRVYEVEAGTTKRWLDITPEQFTSSGRNWDAIYEVNENEFNFYSTGSVIVQ